MQKVGKRTEQGRGGLDLGNWNMKFVRIQISPDRGDIRAGTIGKDQGQEQNSFSMGPAEYFEGLPPKGVVIAHDGDFGGETFEVGIMWPFPSTESTTTSSCRV